MADDPGGTVLVLTFTAAATTAPPNGGTCRLHGPTCTIPWGWDTAHTDSPDPYTLAQLEGRTEPPHLHAYPTADAYRQGWHLWRALRWDAELNPAEADTRLAGVEEHLLSLRRRA